ncbi:zinc ribbon domain-containing protein [Fructilactobacillus fructivorans]|uniref:Zinc-ribbon domain-containing protein n=1 Tax=Fructilactobacillus fructivorans TaxID=1614 RepID=A0A0C1Q395_9LACO|nr:zinc ribbon domain-containing protein [Fructilactobacillus fructivorans]KID42313.1 hypothetical protein LfDm3_0242 [Fructilactobacillus fructivorans]MCT0151068.1 zinc-ribbon domain-containing protein [Fructilactobacillus fructivorans]MCT2867374.1 zinc-ribbon domain-containing protein [Fructilactobacillus fructivorans]MCT2869107.1 zinc-ribbon domain-containing protein [Fructilactobacillus fructivorans]MCT2873173.1 zinc-ribbon domain-containing protein [Fructilactobacillus fructivorans]
MNNNDEKYCVKCGKKIPKETKFCPYCGAKQPSPASNQTDSEHGMPRPIQPGNVQNDKNKTASNLILIFGWLSAGVSLLFVPFLFGIIGVVLGVIELKYHETAGILLIIASVILMIFGIILGLIMGPQEFGR